MTSERPGGDRGSEGVPETGALARRLQGVTRAIGVLTFGLAAFYAGLTLRRPERRAPAEIAAKTSLHLDSSGRVLAERALEAAPGIRGHVDEVVAREGGIVVRGWAADATAGRPAARVVAFVRGAPQAAVVPSEARPDVADALHSAGVLASGFTLTVDLDTPAARSAVRVWAFDEQGRAADLGPAAP